MKRKFVTAWIAALALLALAHTTGAQTRDADTPVAVRQVYAAGQADSLWVVLELASDEYIVRHRFDNDPPDTLAYPTPFKDAQNGAPIAFAPTDDGTFIVYQGGSMERLTVAVPDELPIPSYDALQAAPLPKHKRLLAFTSGGHRPIALLLTEAEGAPAPAVDEANGADNNTNAQTDVSGQVEEPSESAPAAEGDVVDDNQSPSAADAAPTPAGRLALVTHDRGQWHPIDLPADLNIADTRFALVAHGDQLDLLAWTPDTTVIHSRRGDPWTAWSLDLKLSAAAVAVTNRDRTVIVDRPGHEKQLQSWIIWKGVVHPGGPLPLPGYDKLLWSVTSYLNDLTVVVGDGRGNLSWARRDLTQPPDTEVAVQELTIAQRDTPIDVNMMVGAALALAVVILALTWRRRTKKA